MESLLPLRLLVVTVLLLAVRAVRVFTSHRKIALSRPALATCKQSVNYTELVLVIFIIVIVLVIILPQILLIICSVKGRNA